MKLTKILTLIGLIVLSLLPTVSADSSNYAISAVYVNDILGSSGKVQVELGSTAEIEVLVEGTGETTDVRMSAWIGGYEYGDIEAHSDVFDVEDGVSYKKILTIDVPEDLDVASHDYTLHVKVYDSQHSEETEYTLYFEQERHDVVVEDILLSASSVAPGDYFGVKVRLENQGETDEEDLKITVSVPELGISNRVYMDELLSGDQDDASTVYLVIPASAAGEYAIDVLVTYNNGYTEVSESSAVFVSGEMVYDENTYVSFGSIKDLTAGEETTFTVQVTNLGAEAKTFYLTVDGLHPTYIGKLIVPAGSAGAFTVTLSPEDAGASTVFVQVSTDEGLVTQKLFTVDVAEKGSLLAVGIGVLLAVLVIAGIVFYIRKI